MKEQPENKMIDDDDFAVLQFDSGENTSHVEEEESLPTHNHFMRQNWAAVNTDVNISSIHILPDPKTV